MWYEKLKLNIHIKLSKVEVLHFISFVARCEVLSLLLSDGVVLIYHCAVVLKVCKLYTYCKCDDEKASRANVLL